MKVTFYTVCLVVCTFAYLTRAADPECKYRSLRNLPAHWPNPTDCGRFYRCSPRGIRREIICPDAKIYNSQTGKCVKKRRGICKLSLAQPLAAADNICASAVDGTYVPEEGYCRNFFICHNNAAYPQTCAAGSAFNSTALNCVPSSDNSCWQNNCLYESDGQYLPDKTSCTNFYICQNKNTFQQSCSTGSYFNTTTANCQPDLNAENCWENICLDKENGVYVPDSNNCSSYYVCNDQKTTQASCNEGSYFNKDLLVCEVGDCPYDSTTTTPTESTTTTPASTTQNPEDICLNKADGAYVPDSNNCNAYYVCNDNIGNLQTCPAGSYFNKEVLICQVGECPYEPQTTTPGDISTVTPEDGTTTTPNDCTTPSNVCLNKLDGVSVVDPENCKNYYVCNNQKATLQSCPIGSYFNEQLLVCQEGDCPCGVPEESTTTPPVITTTSVPEDCTAPDELCVNKDNGASVVDPENCKNYYVCNNQKATLQSCPIGSYFNEQLLVCQEGDCPCSVPEESTTTPPVIATTSVPEDCTAPDELCLNKDNGVSVVDPENCKNYYVCNNQKATLQSCPVGSYFNEQLLVCQEGDCPCDVPEESTTASPEITTTNVPDNCTIPDEICLNKEDGVSVVDSESCNNYYVCNNLKGTLKTCPSGSYFNKDLLICEVGDCPYNGATSAPEDGVSADEVCLNKEDGVSVVDPENCKNYFVCNNQQGTLKTCRIGSYFNADLLICQVGVCPSNEAATTPDCETTTTPPEPETTTTTPVCETTTTTPVCETVTTTPATCETTPVTTPAC